MPSQFTIELERLSKIYKEKPPVENKLGRLLSDIGLAYIKAYAGRSSFFYFNKKQARLLQKLEGKDDTFAFRSLAALLKSFRPTFLLNSELADALRYAISQYPIEDLGLHSSPIETPTQTLSQDLIAAATSYLTKHPVKTPWYYLWGRHTHQDEARRLLALSGGEDEQANKTAAQAIMKELSPGKLSSAIYSTLKHHEPKTYYDVLRNLPGPSGSISQMISHGMVFIDTKYNIKENAKPKEERLSVPEKGEYKPPSSDERASFSLSASLVDIAKKYLSEHQKPSSSFQFFQRHDHQEQAILLVELEGKTDDQAQIMAADILLKLSPGQLSRGIREVLNEPRFNQAKTFVKEALTEPAPITNTASL